MSELLQRLVRAIESDDFDRVLSEVNEAHVRAEAGDLSAQVALKLAPVLARGKGV